MLTLADLKELVDRIENRAVEQINTAPLDYVNTLDAQAERDKAIVYKVMSIARKHGMLDIGAAQ
jgi:hypothetical protein